jgi:hypothetical protein
MYVQFPLIGKHEFEISHNKNKSVRKKTQNSVCNDAYLHVRVIRVIFMYFAKDECILCLKLAPTHYPLPPTQFELCIYSV